MQDLSTRFKDDLVEVSDRSARRVYMEIRPEAITRVAPYLFRELGARFNTASGTDTPEHVEILYHFTIEDVNLLVSLRVKLKKPEPEIDSLAPCFEAANWIEREMHELLGVAFRGHPEMRRLLLSEEWPEGTHPLRADYREWDEKAVRDRGV